MLKNEEINFLKKNSFLVTGGAGFIGSNIVHFLAENGAKKICVLDNLATGNLDNIQDLISQKKITFSKGDIRDVQTCQTACADIDVVLHHAALGSVQRSIADPGTTNAVNVGGFLNMIFAAKENKVKKFIYASSSSVYGDDMAMPKVESRTGNLLSPYAVTKKMNEEYAKVFNNLFGLKAIGLRYFNVFGPYQTVKGPYAAVIPIFIEAMLSKKPTTIFGDGENTRDFTFVGNVVAANIRAAMAEISESESPVINIAFGGTTSLNTLHRMVSHLTGNNLPPAYFPVRKGDIKDSFADISFAKKILNYSPQINLEEGLKKTVKWFMNKNIK